MTALRGIETLAVVLTASCNLSCSYCFQNRHAARSVTPEVLRAALGLVPHLHGASPKVAFYGGEPLLELPMLQGAIRWIRNEVPADRQPRIALSTNGTLLTDEMLRFFVDHDVELQLSFDGVRPAQDLRGRGSFEALDRVLDALLRDHPEYYWGRVTVAVTLTSENLSHLADTVRYLVGRDAQQIEVSPLTTLDAEWTPETIVELDRVFAEVYAFSLDHYRRTEEVPVVELRRLSSPGMEREGIGPMCGAGLPRKLVVDVDGEATTCEAFAESYQVLPPYLGRCLAPLRLGQVNSPDLERRLAAVREASGRVEILHDKRAKYSSYRRCEECEHLRDCTVCPVAIGHAPEPVDPRRIPDNQCAFQLVSLTYRKLFPVVG